MVNFSFEVHIPVRFISVQVLMIRNVVFLIIKNVCESVCLSQLLLLNGWADFDETLYA